MIINATQIREGNVLIINNELYKVTYTMHRTPGKGNACMQTKLKSIITGKNLEKRFLSNERVEKAELSTVGMQYLFKEPSGFVFMDNETFEQYSLDESFIGEKSVFLKEGETYSITKHDEKVVDVVFPETIIMEVALAPPEIKKATASSSLRPVELVNGMTIQVPAFIKTGDKIRFNIETKEYLERV